jgi:flagellar basal-body rod modification protein FlgD
MTTISDNPVSPALLNSMNASKPAAAAGADTASATQDRFMKLLITQMKNQDPLNPLDNAQVTSQLAQLSTVTGIDKLNATMGTLKDSYQSSQALQATSLIGHGVLVPGNTTKLADGKAVLGMDLPGWDGKTDKGAAAASGQYSFEVSATSAGAALKPTTLSYDQVGSVSTGASGTRLNLSGGGSAALSDVREII